ncbi:unnamed protein product [Trichogramma brassicae]|uniref:Uncharacterized protein n=1 Tax=Trichogramma brassicae TaxID=86971 RepID=A0A6H5I639_9HYME|nr:unnamed protein product [Trichogramma brassicae]
MSDTRSANPYDNVAYSTGQRHHRHLRRDQRRSTYLQPVRSRRQEDAREIDPGGATTEQILYHESARGRWDAAAQ